MFKQTAQRLYQLIGKTKLEDLPTGWQAPIDHALREQEQANPDFKCAEIRGSKPHPSHDDPSDPEDVISVRLKNDEMKTIDRIHVHKDGTVRR
ncbi:hypothetical protein BO78DRAFT_350731 [Aspergillus sclerotiicarbonarius CBS 121057]|uniref:Uncharacterized protein n=1 Tax=Aspergillus sclerotiicarbonarius (strain CBS 121057 / IBT 28362) TaxID=1448318 RepID=A0A319DYP3_ASPSB|nr:hypothetical protein BO78DRAFT_350731 [Aspergillus sclerotiicarbonarius CBS 121057]